MKSRDTRISAVKLRLGNGHIWERPANQLHPINVNADEKVERSEDRSKPTASGSVALSRIYESPVDKQPSDATNHTRHATKPPSVLSFITFVCIIARGASSYTTHSTEVSNNFLWCNSNTSGISIPLPRAKNCSFAKSTPEIKTEVTVYT